MNSGFQLYAVLLLLFETWLSEFGSNNYGLQSPQDRECRAAARHSLACGAPFLWGSVRPNMQNMPKPDSTTNWHRILMFIITILVTDSRSLKRHLHVVEYPPRQRHRIFAII